MIKKIRTEDLEAGMVVADFNTPWSNHAFLEGREVIGGPRDVQSLLNLGIVEVYIDTSRGLDSPRAYAAEEADAELRRRLRRDLVDAVGPGPFPGGGENAGEPPVTFVLELTRARRVYEQARSTVRSIYEDARLGRSIDDDRARKTVEEVIGSVLRNPDALLSLTRLKSLDDYTFHHSLNVAVLAVTLGRHLGILREELLRLGLGAVLHDIGKVRLPERLVRKPDALTPNEFELFKTHCALGARILLGSSAFPDECAALALNHHERFDGSGYPRGISGVAVGKFALITALADVYDAMTTDRSYQRRMEPHHALRRLYEGAGTDFHPLYVQKLIQCLGIYPIGSVVQLDSGEVGVVCRLNRDDLLRPWVRVVLDAGGAPCRRPEDLDLRAPPVSGTSGFARSVGAVVDPAPYGLSLEEVLDERAREPVRG